jgi:hypothetical protein
LSRIAELTSENQEHLLERWHDFFGD